ncbi:MAG: DUF4385 family protein [Bradymonadaceae bacterium]|nr:DUF4385 family protein [Lujinxingiaceae bacterium]
MAGEYDIDFRKHPEQYRYSADEKGVFKVEPYKSELLPLWRYRDEQAARQSARAIREKYEAYRRVEDFVGMDMARKYLQMGFTRAMRYAKYPGGRKYDEDGKVRDALSWADVSKREAAVVFREAWAKVREDPEYELLKQVHMKRGLRRDRS